jgi:hypothetical protein
LIFVLRDEFTDEFISGVAFNLYDGAGNLVGTQTTDSYGKVCFPVNPTQLDDYNMWKLVPKTIPTDLELQDILPVTIGVAKNDHNNPADFFFVNAVHNENSENYGYKVEAIPANIAMTPNISMSIISMSGIYLKLKSV